MTSNRRRWQERCLNAALASLACLSVLNSARATTFVSTKLAHTAGISGAVVQGIIARTDNLVDKAGTPWTIYSLEVQDVLAGEVSDRLLGFRCLGGRKGDKTLVVHGAPALTVGDTIVAFLQQGSICQVSGLENGVFWLRKDADGVDRIVDFRGRVLAALGGEDVVLSAATISQEDPSNSDEARADAGATDSTAPDTRPPPATADEILAELRAFSQAYVTRPETLKSVVDLTDAPTFGKDRQVSK